MLVPGAADLLRSDFALHAGQGKAFVAGGFHRAGLMDVDVAAVGAQDPLPGLEGGVNQGEIGLGGAHKKVNPRLRRIAQGADQPPRLLTVIVGAVARGLHQVGALQQIQNRLGCALAVIAFKTDHGLSFFRCFVMFFHYTAKKPKSKGTPGKPRRCRKNQLSVTGYRQ